MSDLVLLGTILLSAIAYASLQLNLGCLLLLYHSSVGKHVRAKIRTLATGYILGVSLFVLLAIAASCYFITTAASGSLELWQISALIGALVAAGVLIWLVYYRFGGATELWLPRSVANFLHSRAKSTNNPVESFSLGLMACFADIPFSIALIVVSSNSILSLDPIMQFIMICAFVLISVLPLLVLRICLRKGSTVASVQRWRSKNKIFLKILSGALFIVLGIFIFVFEIMGKI